MTKRTYFLEGMGQIITRNVPERFGDAIVFVVDDQRTAFHDAASISHLTLTSTESFRRIHLYTKPNSPQQQ